MNILLGRLRKVHPTGRLDEIQTQVLVQLAELTV